MDRCLLEVVLENLSKMYEEEEREVHFREQTDKKRRVKLHILRELLMGNFRMRLEARACSKNLMT